MGIALPYGKGVVSGFSTSKSSPVGSRQIAIQRLPTDPVFIADVTIDNGIVGSRYWLVDDSDHTTILSSGLITADPEVLLNIPAFSTNFLMLLRLRLGTVPPYYKQFETKIKHSTQGASTFVIQELDS